ncbi:MAG: hypothetical protein AAGC93_23330 [Cyanobacteria bacterium P01_F01_bin.53]
MQLTHIKTQTAQFFQVMSEQQEVFHCRRWGPSLWEFQFGEAWSPVSGRAILESAYQREFAFWHQDSKPLSNNDEPPSLPAEKRLMTALSREQQALISDWLDEEISIYLTQHPHRSISVHEHLGDLSARMRALTDNKAH